MYTDTITVSLTVLSVVLFAVFRACYRADCSISSIVCSISSIVYSIWEVTGQISVAQVSQAEQSRVQQTVAADWRKSRKLQEQKQSLRLLMNGVVGRDALQNRQNTELGSGSRPRSAVLGFRTRS